MAGISGQNGKVLAGATTIAEVTGHNFTRRSNNPAWGSSSIPGEKQRVPGVKDSSGSIDFKYDPDDPVPAVLDAGDTVTLYLYLNATVYHTVPAVIDEISYETDVDEGGIVGGSFSYSQTAAPTLPA